MGSCQCISKQQLTTENESIEHPQSKLRHDSERDDHTNHITSQLIIYQDERIAEENQPFGDKKKKSKIIQHLNVHSDRKNRFLHDMEEEVKYKIRQIQLEEQKIKEKAEKIEKEEKVNHVEIEMLASQNSSVKMNADIQFSFQNSYRSNDDNQNQNPFLPKQVSQFAPKKTDLDSISHKSQISKTPTIKDKSISSNSDIMRKSALLKMKQEIDLHSNIASSGTKKKKLQLESYDKQFTELHSQESSLMNKTQRSIKSILKNHSLSQSSHKQLSKSTHTVFFKCSSRKVHFSKDTNFNNERKGKEKVRVNFFDW